MSLAVFLLKYCRWCKW